MSLARTSLIDSRCAAQHVIFNLIGKWQNTEVTRDHSRQTSNVARQRDRQTDGRLDSLEIEDEIEFVGRYMLTQFSREINENS